MPEDLQKLPHIVGVKQIRRALRDGILQRVYIAEDADPAITEPIAAFCTEQNVNLVFVPSMAKLGRAFGISVGAAAAGLLAPR